MAGAQKVSNGRISSSVLHVQSFVALKSPGTHHIAWHYGLNLTQKIQKCHSLPSGLVSLTNEHCRNYPKLTLQLFPPIELENLLPFDIRYRVHDKSTSTSSTEFLRKVGLQFQDDRILIFCRAVSFPYIPYSLTIQSC